MPSVEIPIGGLVFTVGFYLNKEKQINYMNAKIIPIILVLLFAVVISGCTQTITDGTTGNLVLKLTDKPALNIEKAEVTISQIQVHVATLGGTNETGNETDDDSGNETGEGPNGEEGNGTGGETGNGTEDNSTGTNNETLELKAQTGSGNNESGQGSDKENGNGETNKEQNQELEGEWKTIVEGPVTYDLVQLQDVYQYLGETSLEPGIYTQIRLTVESALVTIDGVEHSLEIPSGNIKMVKSFVIEEGKTTTLILDFDAQQSVHETGAGKYIMKPTIKVFSETEVNEPDENTEEELSLEEKCTASGGTVTTSLCCESTEDFPNLCLIGPCGCAPENSHEINICDCGEGKCFDGESCVEQEAG